MTATIPRLHPQAGIALCRSALVCRALADWISQIEALYAALDAAPKGRLAALSRLVPPGQRFVPTASSFTIGAVLAEENLQEMFGHLSAGTAGAWVNDELRGGIACDRDQAWVRRQYAPGHYPPLHAPHGWHQDGALGFDYLSYRDGRFPADALLPMVTCWIALGSCGQEAPGLEFVTRRLEELLAPPELTNERVRARFASEELWQPVLEPGDALLFRGDILHRTHVMPAMTKDRTSIELRFFPADNIPARLSGDRFIRLD